MNTLISKEPEPTKKRLSLLGAILGVIVLLVGILLGVVEFYFSNKLLTTAKVTFPTVDVTKVTAHAVTLTRVHETEQDGTFGISWDRGQQAAIVGTIISKDQSTVTRQVIQTTAPLAANTVVTFSRDVFLNTALRDTLGLQFQNVQVPSSLGPLPALFVPGSSDTWALLVHAQNEKLDSGLRFFPPLTRLGLPVLEASYRNDENTPASSDHLSHLGDSEWEDLEAAAKYAMDHGAHHLVLYGWSMGGSIVAAFMHRSTYADRVRALVLDAPVLDWRSTLNSQAEKRHLPTIATLPVEIVTTLRTGINFDTLDQLDQAQSNTPVLLFHGTGDTSTPVAVSEAFARKHANIVTFCPVDNAEHIEAWNHDPQWYEAEVSSFLTSRLHLSTAVPKVTGGS